MPGKQGLFIPYKFYDNHDKNETDVYCRGVETCEFRKFTLPSKDWMIINPFKYPTESEEEKIISFERTFKTTDIFYSKFDRYLIQNPNLENFNEDNYKNVSFPPDTYSTKIVMSDRRFYSLFTPEGDWTNTRGSGYNNLQDHHILIKPTPDGNLLFRRVSDPRYQILNRSLWLEISKSIDMIFSTVSSSRFVKEISDFGKEKDYIHVTDRWISEDESIDEWYNKNIGDLYQISFLSSRNFSDIIKVDSKERWERLTNDIILSINLSLYDSPKKSRFPRNYACPGKYNRIYKYSLGEYLLRLMEGSSCKSTLDVWKTFSKLGKWTPIISNVFNYEYLDPNDFIVPDMCIYIDSEFIMTRVPIEEIKPVETIDYVILLAEGSYITFDVNDKRTGFKGLHPLCNHLFAAGKRCIENYMLCSAKNFDVDIDAIPDMTDRNEESLKIITTITPNNINKYRSILSEDLIERIDNRSCKSIQVPMWLGKTVDKVTTFYDQESCVKSSDIYLSSLLQTLDKIR